MRLVLLHALPLDASQWHGQMDILPGATIAPTLYAFGNTMEQWAAGALNAAGAGRLIVVGNSAGGSCALEMARLAPARIEALVLVGAKAGHRPEPDFRDRFISELESDRATTVEKWVGDLLGPNTEQFIRDKAQGIAAAQTLADLITSVRVFHGRRDAADVLSGWMKPLVMVRGEHDRAAVAFAGLRQPYSSPQARSPEATRPGQRLHIVPDCGHYVNLEQPKVFNAILSEVVAFCVANSSREERESIGRIHNDGDQAALVLRRDDV